MFDPKHARDILLATIVVIMILSILIFARIWRLM